MNSQPLKVLVADDNLSIREAIGRVMRNSGFTVFEAMDGLRAFDIFKKERPFLSILDIRMPGLTGIELLRKMKEIDEEVFAVILTAYADMDTTIEAMKLGAFDFVKKGEHNFNIETIVEIARKAATAYGVFSSEGTAIKKDVYGTEAGPLKLIGESPKMQAIYKLIGKLATSDSVNVLISGESGSGKEVVARAIHENSPRAAKPFVAMNCTAIPEALFEQEFFGHEKGAYTGAASRMLGRFEIANGGTLFLDEIAEMKEDMQVKLLRVLEERKFERVGGSETIAVDVRILAATNVNLEEALSKRKLREDLYHRLKVVSIEVPPLRERREDIELFARHFLAHAASKSGCRVLAISEETLLVLKGYDWPGNVRELKHAIESAVAICTHPLLLPEHLPLSITSPPRAQPHHGAPSPDAESVSYQSSPSSASSSQHSSPSSVREGNSALPARIADSGKSKAKESPAGATLADPFIRLEEIIDEIIRASLARMGELEDGDLHTEIMSEVEKRLISSALGKFNGNQAKAAKFLGINRNTLKDKMDKYGL
jgi:DNA-binding NtrC family response regulator